MRGGRPRTAVKTRFVNEVSDTSGKVARAIITTAKTRKFIVGGNIAVATVDGGAIVYLGVHDNIGLVITRASKQITHLFSLIVGCAKIRVAIAGVDFEATKLVDQPDIYHTRNCITAVNGRSAVFENVDMINQPEGKQIEINGRSKREIAADVITGKAISCEAKSVLQDEGFLGKPTKQADF